MKQDAAEKIAERLLERLGLHGWTVSFVNYFPIFDEDPSCSSHRFIGCCSYVCKALRFKKQYIAESSDADVLDLIAHEAAHALVRNDENQHCTRWSAKHEELRASLQS
jgi:hypothetical protein